ncbi:hypothetical protein HZH68_001568 [Vespula germanica]|uniref:Uncharacterized protein n=1 Tax=Vespula germanica TaxID=30212 RepID=A0A834NVS8_VESGE|nr:hypothetical protein HZH68_001568 [Vespula germanica]
MPSGHCQAAPEPFCLPRAAHPRARTSGNYEPRQNSDRTTTGTDIDLRPIICMLIVQESNENSDDSDDGDDDDDKENDDEENDDDILFVLDVLCTTPSSTYFPHPYLFQRFSRSRTRPELFGGDALLSRDKGKCGGKIAEERRGAGTRGSGLDVGGWKRAKRERMRWRRKSRKRRKRRRGGGGGGGSSGGWKVGERDKAEWVNAGSRAITRRSLPSTDTLHCGAFLACSQSKTHKSLE